MKEQNWESVTQVKNVIMQVTYFLNDPMVNLLFYCHIILYWEKVTSYEKFSYNLTPEINCLENFSVSMLLMKVLKCWKINEFPKISKIYLEQKFSYGDIQEYADISSFCWLWDFLLKNLKLKDKLQIWDSESFIFWSQFRFLRLFKGVLASVILKFFFVQPFLLSPPPQHHHKRLPTALGLWFGPFHPFHFFKISHIKHC